jgi:hypothetical protein
MTSPIRGNITAVGVQPPRTPVSVDDHYLRDPSPVVLDSLSVSYLLLQFTLGWAWLAEPYVLRQLTQCCHTLSDGVRESAA